MSRVVNSEVASGLFVLLIGAFAYASIGNLDVGVINDMGPGYLPRALVWLIVGAGSLMTLLGLVRGGEPLPAMQARPLVLVSLAAVVFGATVDNLGLVVAVIASTVIATLASPITRHRETPVLCGLLAVGACLVFIKGLGLSISVWPR